MLNTDKITAAFKAIVEEAEALQQNDLPQAARDRLKTIASIAKHQSDIRQSKPGSCRHGGG
jgi:hypothetical protein